MLSSKNFWVWQGYVKTPTAIFFALAALSKAPICADPATAGNPHGI
jgi:hypothetical protein